MENSETLQSEIKEENKEQPKEVEKTMKNIPLLHRYNKSAIVGEDADLESYCQLPVSKFGLNMLKSMGWHEGKVIGKNQEYNEIVKPIQFVPRYGNAGLGSIPKTITYKNGKIKGNDLVAPLGENG